MKTKNKMTDLSISHWHFNRIIIMNFENHKSNRLYSWLLDWGSCSGSGSDSFFYSSTSSSKSHKLPVLFLFLFSSFYIDYSSFFSFDSWLIFPIFISRYRIYYFLITSAFFYSHSSTITSAASFNSPQYFSSFAFTRPYLIATFIS